MQTCTCDVKSKVVWHRYSHTMVGRPNDQSVGRHLRRCWGEQTVAAGTVRSGVPSSLSDADQTALLNQ